MLIEEFAFRIINRELGVKHEDVIEAYQFINDNWLYDKLTEQQKLEFNVMVEMGIIETAPFRKLEH